MMMKIVVLLASGVAAFTVPGLIPKNYHKGEKLNVLVGPLESQKTGIPLDYYNLNWCDNQKGASFDGEVVGTSYKGNKLVEFPLEYTFGKNKKEVGILC
jgi:hypothetical protein